MPGESHLSLIGCVDAGAPIAHVIFIHHNIGFVNVQLAKGQHFFVDIIHEGILLYDSGRYELAEPRELTAEEYREKDGKYFDHWFESANGFFEHYIFALSKDDYKIAAFQLHQAVERYDSALLPVLTDYKPKTHHIERLGNLAAAPTSKRAMMKTIPSRAKNWSGWRSEWANCGG